MTRLIQRRGERMSTLTQVQTHAFFAPMQFTKLRELKAPFVPQLDGDADTGYFDDFDNPEDMKKYKEVQDKARNVESKLNDGSKEAARRANGGRGMWAGFTFGKNEAKKWGEDDDETKTGEDVFATMF